MPKIVVKVFGDPGEDTYELEEARPYLNFIDQIVVVGGQKAGSFDELVQIITQKHQGKELIEVVQIPAIIGG